MPPDRPTYVGRGFKRVKSNVSKAPIRHRPTYVGRGFKLIPIEVKKMKLTIALRM